MTANHITLASLGVALVYLYAAHFGNYAAACLLILISGLLDAVDGELARLRGSAGPRGAFLDSTIDRLCDGIYILGLGMLGLDYRLSIILLIVSYGISYTRARAESLGLKMEGIGIVERGERIVGILLVVVLLSFSRTWGALASIILIVLSGVTLAERLTYAYRRL